MKKSLAILFAFFLVFAPVYSNAVLPALAAAIGSNGGRVLVGNVIKKVAPQALNNAQKAMVGICKSNPTKCLGLGVGVGGLINAIVGDGWNIEVTNNDVTNNIDVDIYKIPQPNNNCELSFAYGEKKQSASAAYYDVIKFYNDNFPNKTYEAIPNWQSAFDAYQKSEYVLALPRDVVVTEWRQFGAYVHTSVFYYPVGQPEYKSLDSVNLTTYYKCLPYPSNKIDITNNELNQYITNNNINDIDILDIYNFDFSQYNNITIGGDTYNGTTINNDLAKSDPSETDKKVSADLKKKLDAKELSLDDVNDENCTKNEAGEYDKCGADTEPDPDNPDEPEPEKNPACELEENLFRKKICEWIDWTQKEPKPSTSESVDVKDVDAENSNKIDMAGECPAPYELNFSVLGYEQNHSISYEPLCGALVMLKPIFVGSGALSGMFILMGYSRASNTGVNG